MTGSFVVLGCVLKEGLENAPLMIHGLLSVAKAADWAKNRPASRRTRALIHSSSGKGNNKAASKTERLESNSGERKVQDRSSYGRRSS
jgi:hypothetical protein